MEGVFAGLVSSLLVAGLAGAQYQGQEPTKVTVAELTRTSSMYNERPVIVQGQLNYGDMQDTNYEIFELRGDADALRTVRVATGPNAFEDLRFMVGNRVELSGIFFDLSSVLSPQHHPVLRYFPGAIRQDAMAFDKIYFIAVTGIEVVEEIESDLKPPGPEDEPEIDDPDIDASALQEVDLRKLIERPEPYLGKQVVVLGKFRGSNLYGDLSIRDKRTPRDFVIKVADAAIWVTGRRPRGKDFRLDPSKRRDTGKWLRVVGEPWEHDGTVYLRAAKIELADDPEDSDLEPVRVGAAEEKELGPPPEVIFTLPLLGERSIPLDSEFQVQFSKDMKPESFHRNVDLLYADDDGFGNPFPDLEVSYDPPSRTLTVRPHRALEPGKEIRLILYDSIVDSGGQKLEVEEEAREIDPGAAVVLTYGISRG